MTFKIGDSVQYVGNDYYSRHGIYGLVTEITRGNDYNIRVSYTDFPNMPFPCKEEELIHKPDYGPLPPAIEEVLPTMPILATTEVLRTFNSGATRDLDDSKLDYEAFLSPLVLEEYAKYMHSNRKQADGSLRDGDNWQKGIPRNVYMKSMMRHFFDVWKEHRGLSTPDGLRKNLMALLFNVMGYAFELLKEEEAK